MKNKIGIFILFVVIYHLTFNVEKCRSQWVQMSNGMGTNEIIYSFAALGNNIFAGGGFVPTSTGGVYISTNNGLNWTITGLNNQVFRSLSTHENYIIGGTFYNGIFLSTNNGTNWTQTVLNNFTIYSIATLGTNIFVGTIGSGVYISTNNGTNWIQSSLNNRTVPTPEISGNNVYAGTDSGVYISTNNGTNWIQTSLNNKYVSSLAISSNNVFAGVDGGMYQPGGIYFSTNEGINWTQTALNINILSLTTSGNNVFAGTYNGVYLSTNNGANWIQKNQGFIITSFVNIPLFISNNYIFAGIGTVFSPFGYGVWRRDLSEIIGIQNISTKIPSGFSLSQNYPNPFNPTTKIKFDIPSDVKLKTSDVNLIIYDITGREIQTLVNEQLQPGTYEVIFDGSNIASGVYFYQLRAGEFIATKKLILLK